jgi:MinD-like ATPase involved in chromosome partitioning or flagellar assembly
MNDHQSQPSRGIVYTFYSFKGGAGRTMALANVATLLANWGRSVLVVDWDIEAPGIERFFYPHHDIRLRSQPGVIDLLHAHAGGTQLDWRQCIVKLDSGVSMITAGRDDGDYVSKVQGLKLDALFDKSGLGEYIERLRTEWITSFDFVLIDSRTGVTDNGGICTIHLPDVLVLFFTANHSSVEGAFDIATRARKAQSNLPLDRGLLITVPVPSRDETRTEYRKAVQWKQRFARRFHDFYGDWLPKEVKPEQAIEFLRIPYVPYWSFGEGLPAVEEGTSDPGSLGYAYEILARLLLTRLNWYETVQGRTLSPPQPVKPREISNEWLQKHRAAALKGLEKSGKPGFMEVYHFCTDPLPMKDQSQLLTIAEQALIHAFGWPIGVVLRNRDDFRPRPINDGIVADFDTSHDYDYWTLTKNGDFYTLMSLFEDDRAKEALFFDTRIVRTTEAVLHAINIYRAFEIGPAQNISLTIRYGGIKGRQLAAASPMRFFASQRQNLHEDELTMSAIFHAGVSEPEIISLVKSLCQPLFILFDFARFEDRTYQQIVSSFIQGKVL